MKIVGISNGKFLLKASSDELAQLAGYDSNWYYEREENRKFQEGDEISVASLAKHHRHIRTMRGQIANSKKALEGVISGLDLSDEILKPVTEGAAIEDEAK
jgi:hypothetical protein